MSKEGHYGLSEQSELHSISVVKSIEQILTIRDHMQQAAERRARVIQFGESSVIELDEPLDWDPSLEEIAQYMEGAKEGLRSSEQSRIEGLTHILNKALTVPIGERELHPRGMWNYLTGEQGLLSKDAEVLSILIAQTGQSSLRQGVNEFHFFIREADGLDIFPPVTPIQLRQLWKVLFHYTVFDHPRQLRAKYLHRLPEILGVE